MASAKKEQRLRGVYLVPDPLMMKPRFGPSEHIKAGMRELSKHFDMNLLVLGEAQSFEHTPQEPTLTSRIGLNNGLVGMFRDMKLYVRSNRNRAHLMNRLMEMKPDFIYERGQYLDLRGVRAAAKLNIPHFYEVNWLNFLGIRQFYKSWFNSLAKQIEEKSYRHSTLNFFIGTQHKLINIPKEKVFTIQNGIEEELIDQNKTHVNRVVTKVKLCYVANLMPHHRFDVFCDALHKCGNLERVELHTIGYNFESELHRVPQGLTIINHGPKNKADLAQLLSTINLGIISGGPSYSSFMKLFEYAAFKLCVICPNLENIKLMFNENEVAYFETDNAASMASRIKMLLEMPFLIEGFGHNIYEKVKRDYTWTQIYKGVATQICQKVRV